ncbi:hypothetical protein KY330_04590 [Candidatus Woesearchaeota archaeon]|nr:hypothetical protein [Candidatus Woesearchaeota archaeon]
MPKAKLAQTEKEKELLRDRLSFSNAEYRYFRSVMRAIRNKNNSDTLELLYSALITATDTFGPLHSYAVIRELLCQVASCTEKLAESLKDPADKSSHYHKAAKAYRSADEIIGFKTPVAFRQAQAYYFAGFYRAQAGDDPSWFYEQHSIVLSDLIGPDNAIDFLLNPGEAPKKDLAQQIIDDMHEERYLHRNQPEKPTIH